MRIDSSPPAGLLGFAAEFRFVPETAPRRRVGELWQIWFNNGSGKAGPAALDEVIRITFAEAGVVDLEARDAAGEVLHTLRYRVCATLADELEAAGFCGSPPSQLSWVQAIRGRGTPALPELERLIKEKFLNVPGDAERWARGIQLLVCLHYPELLRCRPPRTSPEAWEDALESVVVTFLRKRDYLPEMPFRPFCARLLYNECVNDYRDGGYPNPDEPN